MKKLAAALIGLTICASARAEFWSGNDLLQRLQSTEIVNQMAGLGYVMGVFDAAQGAGHCAPNNTGISTGQVRDMARLWLEQNPVQRNMSADRLVVQMLSEIWPCRGRGSL
jgi:hypothetical protein